MIPGLLSVFLDYRCNFACQHCSVGSSPKTIFPMPDDVLDAALSGVADVPSLRVVVFTGGEPTMRKGVLLASIARAKELGVITRIVTNAWWASTPEKADRWVGELRDAGLDELSTSWDDFHAPFAQFECVVNAVRAALAAGIRVALATINDRDATYSGATVRAAIADALETTVDEIDNLLFLVDDNPTPSGTAKDLDVSGMPNDSKLEIGCREVVHTLSVHPDGSVKACCGHEQFYAPDLTIGNLREETFAAIAARAQQNLLYWMIHSVGPKRMLEQLGVEGEYASICHACGVLLHEHRDELMDYLAANRDDVFVRDILFSDNVKRLAGVVARRKQEVLDTIGGARAGAERAGREGAPVKLLPRRGGRHDE